MSNIENLRKVITELKEILPNNSWSENKEILSPYLTEWRDRWRGQAPLLLLPKSTREVSLAVKICNQHNVPLTIQGGNTGLVGGQIPQGEILLSTKYLNQIRQLNEFSLIVESGCILQTIQELADSNNKLFPLSLASQGSATIGGLCSTNAGGVHVVRYGSMRDLVIGVEAVLADGTIFNSLNPLKKDNTGYNLTSLLLGAEGTLGIITAVQLKTYQKPVQQETLFLALDNLDNCLETYKIFKQTFTHELSLIELIPSEALKFVTEHIPKCSLPFTVSSPWYVLLQCESTHNAPLLNIIEETVKVLLENNIIIDAVLAKTIQQTKNLIKLRESISEAQKPQGGSIKHDISVPIGLIPEFITQATKAVEMLIPNCRPIPFGHLGDGNIHFNVSQPQGMDKNEYLSYWKKMNRIVHDIVIKLGGSISAEHGIGILKKEELAKRCDPVKYATMKSIKLALDPKKILNPRVLL